MTSEDKIAETLAALTVAENNHAAALAARDGVEIGSLVGFDQHDWHGDMRFKVVAIILDGKNYKNEFRYALTVQRISKNGRKIGKPFTTSAMIKRT